MKRWILMLTVISCAACTTLRPIEGNPAEIRQRIISGDLLEVGDRVSIVTKDENTHRLTVTAISPDLIEGRTDSVPMNQIISLKKRTFSRGKTLALVGAVVLATGLVIYAESQITLLRVFARAN